MHALVNLGTLLSVPLKLASSISQHFLPFPPVLCPGFSNHCSVEVQDLSLQQNVYTQNLSKYNLRMERHNERDTNSCPNQDRNRT